VCFESEASLFGNFGLQSLDLRMEELDHASTIEAQQMIVMLALFEFEECTARIDIGSAQQARLLELQ